MQVESVFAFVVASLVLAFVPGPDNLFVMTQSALRGSRAGLTVVLGLCTGLILHTAAVALGVAALFQTSQLAFSLLKYAGSAYLLYLAWQAFRERPSDTGAPSDQAEKQPRFYLRGIVMNVTNPKVSIFFLAFLPQFVNHQAGHVTLQLFTLGGIFILCTLFAFSLMSLLAARAGARFRQSARTQLIMNRLAGLVFVALAAKLATSGR